MNIRLILSSALVLLVLAACNKDDTYQNGSEEATGVAYLSLKVQQQATKASDERDAANESTLESIYLITFDDANNVLPAPGINSHFIEVLTPSSSPTAFKVSARSESILIIANPGEQLKTAIRAINSLSSFTSINQAIKDATFEELTDDVEDIKKGFAMINGGLEEGKDPTTTINKITTPLIDISQKIKKVSETQSEEQAKIAAETDYQVVVLERLASKLDLNVKAAANLEVKPDGATFDFDKWTLDGLNETFYPFAEKTLLTVSHVTVDGYYKYNFYTEDPNFSGTVGEYISYGKIDPDTYDPILVPPYEWMEAAATTYCIENTMAASEQRFGNATRIVIKGKYYPEDGWTGDWFNFAGINYETLTELQDAYKVAGATNLQEACDKMYNKIEEYATIKSIPLTGTDFITLIQDDLDKIQNGGEVIKTDKDTPCIRWYQKGLSYYYYQIRHDDQTELDMAFGKYGVVRNNWYSLTVSSVNGAGTPWYPDIDNPGPGDPDPTDPIDESSAYLGIQVDVAPWIIWEREIGI